MRIHSKPEKKSGLRKLQEFLVYIHLIPVSTERETGDFKLKLISCRVLIGFIIWTLTPFMCFCNSTSAFMQRLWTNTEFTILYKVVTIIAQSTEPLMVIFLPLCLAKLFHHCNQLSRGELKFPNKKLSFVCLLLVICYPIITGILKTYNSLSLIPYLVYAITSALDTMFSMFLINMMLSSLSSACRNLIFAEDASKLGDESLRVLSMYRSMKIGLGPILLFLFSLGVFLMIALAYLSTSSPNPEYTLYYIMVLGKNIILLVNISLASHDCFSELLAIRHIIRYIFILQCQLNPFRT